MEKNIVSTIDLENLSVAELEELKSGIAGAIEGKRNSELLELRAKVDELIDNSPFTLEEILEAKAMRKPVLPKYMMTNDPELTWTGRGRKPRWIVAYLENGGDLDELLIK